ncbi:MAG: hypothetical protein WCX27_00135 [Candidatus Paceibacterota bacterium]|jgi:tetrahydromethanopterin S-methyltransferase subunit A/thymidylate synthase
MKDIKTKFPLVEAILLTPEEGAQGIIGICTNTTSAGEVLSSIEENNRKNVAVLGSLIVSRDGVERMILNCLAHPTQRYLILFSEETVTFAPSTNLLQAMQNGFVENKEGNYIKEGIAASPYYPNLSKNIFNIFKDEIIVLPVFMHKNAASQKIIENYLNWLKPKTDPKIIALLEEINKKDKIYYDSLNKLISLVASIKTEKKTAINIDPKEYRHLEPPKIILSGKDETFDCPFKASVAEGKYIRLDIRTKKGDVFIKSENPFIVGYTLLKFLGKEKDSFSHIEQLVLGAELGRASIELSNSIETKPFVKENNILGTREIPVENQIKTIIDKKYYYKINNGKEGVRVMCMAFDACEEIFELISESVTVVLEKIAELDRFERYEMDFLHRLDVGTQTSRAGIAAKFGYSFIQDFIPIFKINKTKLPFLVSESDSFLDTHKSVLRKIYTEGITENHGDEWKGLARSASVLAIYRDVDSALKIFPEIYRQGNQTGEEIREAYKSQLMRKDNDGTYTYGERTRAYFGFDQMETTKKTLLKNKDLATIVQRFDPVKDMSFYIDTATKKLKFSHDPCLTHDIFFVENGKLHSFHIARAHNAVNAYPENIFGLHDAYVAPLREALGLRSGDMFMLSNRANILLLSEEQRTKKILAEPSKPCGEVNMDSGPYDLKGKGGIRPKNIVAIFQEQAKESDERPKSRTLDVLENYNSVNILNKAIEYLVKKGGKHNNPIIGEYIPGKTDPQSDMLAFFQANVYGEKIYATAVFMNHSIKNLEKDRGLVNYLVTQYKKELGNDLGESVIIYVGRSN